MQIELLHALQFILMIVLIMSVTCHIVHTFKVPCFLSSDTAEYIEIKTGLSYSKELTVVECESFHRYQIWRFYLFS